MHPTTEEIMQTIGSLAETIERDPAATLLPVGDNHSGQFALETLRRLQNAEVDRLKLGATLGEGGMGVVRRAEQVALGREVAVKTLKPDFATDAATMGLLREAWVTGGLEHPNIVPIYDMGLDDMGRPEIVLKRIEGEHWGELMFDADKVEARHGARDLLEWNLNVFRQVTRAVHFAHSRGIVHRDLKPENVMIGAFGEVYLVDWGIALSLEDDGGGRYRLAKDAQGMAGTPCYMAPEMLGGTESRISERTDVYLLGATLFEVVEGRPPHEGSELKHIIGSILTTPPPLRRAPAELASVIRRAMDGDPAARFETADELGLAVEDFLRHRGSRRLQHRAERSLEALEREIVAAENGHEERCHLLYTECRFGFREALSAWAENEAAREGRRRATELMVEFELARGSVESAERLLADLDEPDASLAGRVATARDAADSEQARLEALDADQDMSAGQRTRAVIVVAIGLTWIFSPLTKTRMPLNTIYEARGLAISLSMLGLALGMGYWARQSLTRTLPNRRMFATLVLTLSSNIAFALGAKAFGIPPLTFYALLLFSWAIITGMLSVFADRRLWPSAVAFLGAFYLATVWPERVLYIMSAANLMLTLNAVYVWRPAEGYFTKRDQA